MPKSLGRLVPTKKSVYNKKTGSTSEITYYINPNKEQPKGKKAKGGNEESTPVAKSKEDKSTLSLDGVKDFEDFGKKGIDPTAARQFFCNM